MFSSNFEKELNWIVKLAIFGVITILVLILYSLYSGFKRFFPDEEEKIIETKTALIPTYKVSINGNKRDTTFIYKLPQ